MQIASCSPRYFQFSDRFKFVGELGVKIYGETAEYDSVGLEFLPIRRIQRQPLRSSCELIGSRIGRTDFPAISEFSLSHFFFPAFRILFIVSICIHRPSYFDHP
jgi:hypothetical protein